ncbi:MAG: DNA alkylation repair protein [Bacilli bacterium]|nr:DNA alkylation repair protein [Bacilli bacterium]MDD4077269.1 DNA alkylation repair protein [Bacilli bacterium]MDD4388750.1 DNA alkylation repair protein [Bacilli bacterium]
MEYQILVKEFEKHQNPTKAKAMAAYMRNQFLFYGIPTPERRKITAPILKEMRKFDTVDWNFISKCWENPYREMQYVAGGYIAQNKSYLTIADIERLKSLAITKSWWDTIDGLDTVIGYIAFYDKKVNEILLEWSVGDNIWLRRIAIDHQLKRKEKTDTVLLEKIICNNFGTSEFFINKAIGWSLREYSKTNRQWVKSFINKHRERLASLSIREASKYLGD